MDAKELIRKWLEYAKLHRIRAGNSTGAEPTTTDVIDFLVGEGFSADSVNDIVSQFVVSSDKVPDAVSEPANDIPLQQKYTSTTDDNEAEDLPDLTQSQEEDLAIVYRIIGKLDTPQLMQLKRELKYV